MTNWLVYSPFSKNSFWGQLSDQLNRTNETVSESDPLFLSINEIVQDKGKKGFYLGHWSKVDAQFELAIHPTSKNLIAIKPNTSTADENPFQRIIDTTKIKEWLEEYDWVGFGYIILPESINRYTAMTRSTYYTRNSDSDFVLLETNKKILDEVTQATQTWFIATKAADDLIVMFCHPDVIVPGKIEYQIDNNGDTYYCYLHENFDYFDMVLKPSFNNSIIAGDTIYSKEEWIDVSWGTGSFLNENTAITINPPKPFEILTDLAYTSTDTGMRIKNQKGSLTLKYKVSAFLKPSMRANSIGLIEKHYIILG